MGNNEPMRLDSVQLAGVAAITPDEVPPGLGLDYPGVCRLLTEHARLVLPEDGDQVIEPRPDGYALIALADANGLPLTAVTTEVGEAQMVIAGWCDGVAYPLDFAITADTAVAFVDGWPVPVMTNPDTQQP